MQMGYANIVAGCVTFSLSLLSTTSNASTQSFRCTVHQAWELTNSGELQQAKGAEGYKVGKEFVVDRGTGRIISGAGLQNYGIGGGPKILHPGDAENPFRVLTIYETLNPVSVLEVKVWKSQDHPPFIYYDQGSVFSGICQAYR
jgi:hypothetical protein